MTESVIRFSDIGLLSFVRHCTPASWEKVSIVAGGFAGFMRLSHALNIIQSKAKEHGPSRAVQLACGATPLHLQTFLNAHIQLRSPAHAVQVETGLFGDLIGTLKRAATKHLDSCVVLLEWPDLDLRLGYRSTGGWSPKSLPDIVSEAGRKLQALARETLTLADNCKVAVAGPTLPLAPVGYTSPSQASLFELKLWQAVNDFCVQVGSHPNVRVINQARLAQLSPPPARLDLKLDLAAGFPYQQLFADALAELVASALYPKPPKKGLITDLDHTTWSGILGEVGVEGVSWNIESGTQLHGLYQQLLAALADSGVLIAVASRNDPKLVEEALARSDCLVPRPCIFPIDAHWGAKSDSVSRILKTWNVSADSVVVVDDSPLELAEVQSKFPEVECLLFDAKDPEKTIELFWRLRELFGKPELTEEDQLRSTSLSSSRAFENGAAARDPSEFLATVGARITIDYRRNPSERRAFELVNKTNQFNINGRRYTEAEWQAAVSRPGAFLAVASYEDKFGPLGRVSVVLGETEGNGARIQSWVMSCRAFARHIEYQILRRLFDHLGVSEIQLCYSPTERNGPLREFLGAIRSLEAGKVVESAFREHCPPLFQEVKEITDG